MRVVGYQDVAAYENVVMNFNAIYRANMNIPVHADIVANLDQRMKPFAGEGVPRFQPETGAGAEAVANLEIFRVLEVNGVTNAGI
jgi:hypothetical protein